MVEVTKNFGSGATKQEIFDAARKKMILQTIKDGFVIQTQDGDIEEYVAYDVVTKKPILKVRENYSSGRSTVVYNDKVYTKKDRRYITGDINHRLTDAESPESLNSINESDFSDIYGSIASVAIKVR